MSTNSLRQHMGKTVDRNQTQKQSSPAQKEKEDRKSDKRKKPKATSLYTHPPRTFPHFVALHPKIEIDLSTDYMS